MKGFWHWFKSSNKMKRWIFLILIGILLACYGLAEILIMKEISFQEVGKVIVIFVVGFVAIVLGLIFLNKRTLEVLIEATDERMENKKNVNINSLIFNKTVYDKGPNIVVIGGGTGLNTVLQGMKKYTSNITAIVNVSDGEKLLMNSREEVLKKILGVYYEPLTEQMLLATVFGGILLGVGVGLVIHFGGCVDGTESVALVISKKTTLSIGQVVLVFNLVIYSK